jgi:CelD/BcsL family acetyltransferase involved in cellulose biosynthesis
VRVRELTFLTVPDTQFCDVIAAERHRASATAAFAAELARRANEWDVMRLKYLATNSVAIPALADALKSRGFTTRATTLPGNPFVRLDSSWAAYYATRSRRLKKANNLAANRLKKMGDVRVEYLAPERSDPTEVDHFLERAIAISARSWKRDTGNSLDRQGPQAFIRRLSELAAREGWLSLWIMSVNGRPLAMEYQLVAYGNVFALRSDFDAEFEDVSPGAHLNRCMLEGLFGRGLRRYYMGPGNNAYKHRWAEEVEPVQELTVYGHTLAGRAAAAWETTIKPMAVSVRDRLLRSSESQS